MVLAVLQIRSLGKILNPWYACNVAKNATLSDVYNEFSSGNLDQGMPLPEKYPTTAYIGKRPDQLTRISRYAWMYLEFDTASTGDNEGLQIQSNAQPEASVNAFTMLISASKAKSCVLAKYNIMQPSVTLKLKNDTIACLRIHLVGKVPTARQTVVHL